MWKPSNITVGNTLKRVNTKLRLSNSKNYQTIPDLNNQASILEFNNR